MTTFLTGSTGYLGGYVAHRLVNDHGEKLALLVRAKNQEEAVQRLWKSFQMHMDFETFEHAVGQVDIYLGDLTMPKLGLSDSQYTRLAHSMTSVIHCAASLNRKSNKVCFNVNLRGTLEVLKLAQVAEAHHGLRRFSDVSTAAVAGHRFGEVVTEDETIDWNRSQYDPYAQTKFFCEHMVHELLPNTEVVVFRPTIVLGDSRFPQTTQFDMLRAFVFLTKLPVLPLDPESRVDIVPADYVADGLVAVHQAETLEHHAYNLSSGTGSLTVREIARAVSEAGLGIKHRFVPRLGKTFESAATALMSTPRNWGLVPAASLMKVFWPYITYDTVMDNTRIQGVLGRAPLPISEYAYPLVKFAESTNFTYPYAPFPAVAKAAAAGPGLSVQEA